MVSEVPNASQFQQTERTGRSSAKAAGHYGDGGGLVLQVYSSGARGWLFRYRRGGRIRETRAASCRLTSRARLALSARRPICSSGSWAMRMSTGAATIYRSEASMDSLSYPGQVIRPARAKNSCRPSNKIAAPNRRVPRERESSMYLAAGSDALRVREVADLHAFQRQASTGGKLGRNIDVMHKEWSCALPIFIDDGCRASVQVEA